MILINAPQGRITAGEVLFLIMKQGIMLGRARLKQYTAEFEHDGFRRTFRHYDGQPMWTPLGSGDTVVAHPRGWQSNRTEASGRCLWRKAGAQPVWETQMYKKTFFSSGNLSLFISLPEQYVEYSGKSINESTPSCILAVPLSILSK